MATIQTLKKKLRGIRSTQKITKAMKTASTVKYSKLNETYAKYSVYAAQYKKFYDDYKGLFHDILPQKDISAPVCYVVMGSNKGMCGSFNNDVFSFALDELKKEQKEYYLIVCGKQAISYFERKHIHFDASFVFNDVPKFEDTTVLLNEILRLQVEKIISGVKIIYPKFKNMMVQNVVCDEVFGMSNKEQDECEDMFYLPDKTTLISALAHKALHAFFYEYLLETALGAQASTVMTMRSAYDTATQYCAMLEGEINRKRQSQVTADVIETSAEQKD